MITFQVNDIDGSARTIEIPEGINLTLMEVLKASEYPIKATCGGMALCATCHVEIRDDSQVLDNPRDQELDMIDTLPNASEHSRLACQISVDERLEGLTVVLRETAD